MMILQQKTLTTLQVYYYMPDYNNIIQEFVWQYTDRLPKFPRTHTFLNFWHYTTVPATIARGGAARNRRWFGAAAKPQRSGCCCWAAAVASPSPRSLRAARQLAQRATNQLTTDLLNIDQQQGDCDQGHWVDQKTIFERLGPQGPKPWPHMGGPIYQNLVFLATQWAGSQSACKMTMMIERRISKKKIRSELIIMLLKQRVTIITK